VQGCSVQILSSGLTAVHSPLQSINPVLVSPQLFASDVHSWFQFVLSVGFVAGHDPSHKVNPEVVSPQLLASEIHGWFHSDLSVG